jgi:hypothetical protein
LAEPPDSGRGLAGQGRDSFGFVNPRRAMLPTGKETLLANIHQTFINRPKRLLKKQNGTNTLDYSSY